MFANARKHGRALICLESQAKGYSPKDVKTYRCGLCGEHGHLKFEQSNLKKPKSRGGNQTKNAHCIHHAMVRSDGQEEMSAFGKRTGAFWREHASIERRMRPFKDRKHALAKVGISGYRSKV